MKNRLPIFNLRSISILLTALLSFALQTHATVVTTTNDFGAGSLRQAVIDASPGDTITFTNSLDGATILLTGGQIILDKNLTLDASGLSNGLTVSGNNSSRIFKVNSGTINALLHLTLTEGKSIGTGANGDGGAIHNAGDLLISASTIHGNSAGSSSGGGAIYNAGTLLIIASTIHSNTADYGGGAIFSESGSSQLTMNQCTVTDNTAGFGGAFLFRNNGAMSLAGCTVYGNTGTGGTGGIVLESSASLTLQNTILAENEWVAKAKISDLGGLGGTVTIVGHNFIGVQSSGYAAVMTVGYPNINGDYVGTSASPLNPLLAPLGDYGGSTQTMPPLSGSPVINTGDTASTNSFTDQRGLARVFGPAVDIGAVEAAPIVTTTADSGEGSLRQVISNALSGQTISFISTLAGETIVLTNGQLTVSNSLTITASDLADGITIDGNGLINSNRIFEFTSGTTNLLEGFTLTNGLASGGFPDSAGGAISVNSGAHLSLNHSLLSGNGAESGGAIFNFGTFMLNDSMLSGNSADFSAAIENAGTLVLNRSTLSGNSAEINGGAMQNGGSLTINDSTLSGNSAGFLGGGIYNFGTLTLNHSTFSGNSADIGGGIRNYGMLSLNHSTLSGNTANTGGGISNEDDEYSTVSSTNSIVAGNIAPTGANIAGPISSDISNVISGDPFLAPLGDYGGPTQTMPPLPRSPAIDAGLTSATNSLTDQRGFSRVLGSALDIGAVEYDTVDFPITVDTVADENGSLSNGISLREAISFASGFSAATIEFDPALSGQSILLTNGQILVEADVIIDASALPGGLIIDGNGTTSSNRIFEIAAHTTNVFNNMVFSNGLARSAAPFKAGGAILLNAGSYLTVNDCLLSDNSADDGGAILVPGGSSLMVNASTFSDNSANDGGGIRNNGGTVEVNSSTFVGNTARWGGACIWSSGSLAVNNSTLAGNSAGIGAIYNDALTTLNNTTISGNNIGIQNNGVINSTNTIVAGNSRNISHFALNAFHSQTNGTPLLAPLGDYGGPTQTMPPLPGSLVIDAGGSTTHPNDQRGFSRVVGPSADIGAVEFQGDSDLILLGPVNLATVWNSDSDGDGNVFGVEHALGTDWSTADGSGLAALSSGGAVFGFNPDAANHTAWILKRSVNLVTDPFVEIYRYDGPTDTTTTNLPVSVTTTAFGIEVQDQSGVTNAYYQFEAQLSP